MRKYVRFWSHVWFFAWHPEVRFRIRPGAIGHIFQVGKLALCAVKVEYHDLMQEDIRNATESQQ